MLHSFQTKFKENNIYTANMMRKKFNNIFISRKKRKAAQENGKLPSGKLLSANRRLVNKEGDFHVSLEKIGHLEKFRRYVADFFTTFIDVRWRWTLFVIVSGFFFTWLAFAAFYYLFGYINGDMDDQQQTTNPCIANVRSFTAALLFSVESQHTIGYGYRYVTEECPHAIMLVFFQFILGVGVQCLIAGIFFVKLQRAKKRSQTIMFSTTACIGKFNGKLYLSLRVGNLRSSLLLGVRAMGMLVKKRLTNDGEEVPLTQHHIDFVTESHSDIINMLWPTTIYHLIDETSPLFKVSKDEVLAGYSELVVVMEGVTDSTSKAFQARTSYLPPEIFFDFRFKSMSPVLTSEHTYQMSYYDFNMVLPTNCRPRNRLFLREIASQTAIASNDETKSNEKTWHSLAKVEFPTKSEYPDDDQSVKMFSSQPSIDRKSVKENDDILNENSDDNNAKSDVTSLPTDAPTTVASRSVATVIPVHVVDTDRVRRISTAKKTFTVCKLPDESDSLA